MVLVKVTRGVALIDERRSSVEGALIIVGDPRIVYSLHP